MGNSLPNTSNARIDMFDDSRKVSPAIGEVFSPYMLVGVGPSIFQVHGSDAEAEVV